MTSPGPERRPGAGRQAAAWARWCLGALGGILIGLGFAPAAAGPAPERAAALEALVSQDCGSCHGMTRRGGLGPPLTREALSGIGEEALAATILDGRAGTPMPPWRGLLTEDEAHWIVRQLLEESPR